MVVNRESGRIHLAKAIINFGARGSNTVDRIVVAVYVAKESLAHQQHISDTRRPGEDVVLARKRYKSTASHYYKARILKERRWEELTSYEQTLRSLYDDGSLWSDMVEARMRLRALKPRPSQLMRIITYGSL